MDDTRYQIFVSSTFRDLKEEREKVLQAILQLKAFPAGMELFPAANDQQFDFINREISSSDYYVLIIAGKYGSLDEEGLSFTEKEYDYACSIDKPILAFLVRDTDKLLGEKLETTDALRAKLGAFRSKASKNRLVTFYSNPDELKSEVLRSLTLLFIQQPMRGWVRAGQQSLESLQELATLQREFIKLKSENERLQSIQNQPELHLAHGMDETTWVLDFNYFCFDNKWPTQRSYTLTTTWNQLLVAIFSSGSSQATENEVRRRLAKFILDSCSEEVGSTEWRQTANEVINKWATLPVLKPVDLVLGAVLVQFNGLELIQESKETIYVSDQYNLGRTTPQTVDIWRLTPKGQHRLAIAMGQRRN